VPDLLIKLGDLQVLLECKTCTKKPPLIKKDEAFAILQKASDFDKGMRRVTLGKPGFDEHSKMKAQGSPDITLVEHSVFSEGLLRVHSGAITSENFLKWLVVPGLSEIGRLEGKPTYATT
jgi:helicase